MHNDTSKVTDRLTQSICLLTIIRIFSAYAVLKLLCLNERLATVLHGRLLLTDMITLLLQNYIANVVVWRNSSALQRVRLNNIAEGIKVLAAAKRCQQFKLFRLFVVILSALNDSTTYRQAIGSGTALGSPSSLPTSGYTVSQMSSRPVYIVADKPILVGQFAKVCTVVDFGWLWLTQHRQWEWERTGVFHLKSFSVVFVCLLCYIFVCFNHIIVFVLSSFVLGLAIFCFILAYVVYFDIL